MNQTLIVIPLHNKEDTICRTMQSVLEQTYTDFDLLIVNDGSTDYSLKNIQTITDDRIITISQVNKGVSAARNVGLIYAQENKYRFVSFIDADDYWQSNHLATLIDLFNRFPETDVAASNYYIKRSSNVLLETKFSNLENHGSGIISDFFEKNYLNSILTSSSFALKTASIKPVGLYNENFSHGEDTDFFIRMGIHLKISFTCNKTTVIDKSANDRSDGIPMSDRLIFDLLTYEKLNIKGLKKYLDLNRFSIALAFRMEGDIKKALCYQHKIVPENLSPKQQKLLNMNKVQLKTLYKTKMFLEYIGLDLRTS